MFKFIKKSKNILLNFDFKRFLKIITDYVADLTFFQFIDFSVQNIIEILF